MARDNVINEGRGGLRIDGGPEGDAHPIRKTSAVQKTPQQRKGGFLPQSYYFKQGGVDLFILDGLAPLSGGDCFEYKTLLLSRNGAYLALSATINLMLILMCT